MEIHKIISSGSQGNSVMLFNRVLVDIGVPFKLIEPDYKQIQIVTWSHAHFDHLNPATLKKLVSLRPGLRIAVGEHLAEEAMKSGSKNIDILKMNQWYNYNGLYISIFNTYHDVPSNGWRFAHESNKVFFCTDTSTLEGITAKDYSHFFIEHNYNEETVWDIIREKESRGEYAHQRGSINSHLSKQQAQEFFYANRKPGSVLIPLHESKESI